MLNRYLITPLAAALLLAAALRAAQAQTGGGRIGTAGAPDASAAPNLKAALVPDAGNAGSTRLGWPAQASGV